jgi:hypothetical protein
MSATSSTVASLGRLTVLEIAPDRKGCVAAIIFTCAIGARKRRPWRPQRLAQSNTGRCSSRTCGAPSTVERPSTWSPRVSISERGIPQWESSEKVGERDASSTPRRFTRSAPSVKGESACSMEKAPRSAASTRVMSSEVKPLPFRYSRLTTGALRKVLVPLT